MSSNRKMAWCSAGGSLVSRSVENPRYSECGSAKLADLDWLRGWWTDDSFGAFYLHVWHKDGETVHRVRCKGCQKPRLSMKKGRLRWLYVDGASKFISPQDKQTTVHSQSAQSKTQKNHETHKT